MQLVLSPAEKENLRALVAATRQSLAPASPLQGPLQILQDLLAPGTAALSPQASLQLQHLLRAAALPAGSVHSVYVGEEASPQCAGSMVNGLLEDLPKVSVQGFKLEMAKPVVANVFHASREVIENLGRVGNETVSVMPYAGQLPEVLGAQGRFGQDVADRVTGRGLFSPASLAPERALAQAYFRWAKQGNAQNNKLLAGVVIRRLKYLARAQEGLPEQRVPLEQALDAANQLFRESAAFRTQALILGTRGAEDIVAPRSLSLGALLGYSWVWSHTRVRGEFTLNPDLENSLRRQRLRNFRMSGAA
jgi:hypothetical protein